MKRNATRGGRPAARPVCKRSDRRPSAKAASSPRSSADDLAGTVRSAWRANPARWLGDLRELTEARWRLSGELAFLLEPDLKEARGGARDAVTLRALAYAQLVDAPRGAVRAAYRLLLDVRDALHRSAGRLLLAEQDAVADALGYLDADVLLREVADAARTVAYTSDTAWRQVDGWLARRRRWPVASGPTAVAREGRCETRFPLPRCSAPRCARRALPR